MIVMEFMDRNVHIKTLRFLPSSGYGVSSADGGPNAHESGRCTIAGDGNIGEPIGNL